MDAALPGLPSSPPKSLLPVARPGSAVRGGLLPGRDACAVVAEQVAGLAVECLAEPGQGAEPDRPGMAVLQDGQVDHADADPFGQLGQGHAPVGEELVEVDDDGVAIGSCAIA